MFTYNKPLKLGCSLLSQRLQGRKHFPLVLMLELLFRCNLACPGCGKIQHPTDILKKHLTPEQCIAAVEECGSPIVSIPGGEPLLHPQIDKIVKGLYLGAPDQEHFLKRERTKALFRKILSPYKTGNKNWNFNHNP